MNLLNHIKTKINKVMELRNKANVIEHDIMEWFESKGFDTGEESFLRVTDKLSNCEGTPDQIEDILEDIREGIYR